MNKNREIPWNIYKVYLPIAEELFSELYPEPTNALEIAEKTNKVGVIIKTILSNEIKSVPMFCKIHKGMYLDKDNILWRWRDGLWIGLPSVQTYFLKRVWKKDLKKEVKKYEDDILKLSREKQLKELKEWKDYYKKLIQTVPTANVYKDEILKLEKKINDKISEEEKENSKKIKKQKFSDIEDWKKHMNDKYNKRK